MGILKHAKPRIVVTGPDQGGLLSWLFIRHAIRRAGGRPVHVTPRHADRDGYFDGLVIGGGADVDPGLYGGRADMPRPQRDRSLFSWLLALILYPLIFFMRRLFSTKHYLGLDKARDELEYRLLEKAITENKPVLGICRGAQLINVYRQGNLHQDISSFYTESPKVWSVLPLKTIHIESDSCLRQIFDTDQCQVNALHNQSIDRLGEGLVISAHESNGIVQAIEDAGHSNLLGVQWHPEYLPHHRRQQRLFEYLIERAAEQGGERFGTNSETRP